MMDSPLRIEEVPDRQTRWIRSAEPPWEYCNENWQNPATWIGYNKNIMRQTACLVVNPIKVNSFAYLFNCTTVGGTSD